MWAKEFKKKREEAEKREKNNSSASRCMNNNHEDLLVNKDGIVGITLSRQRNTTTELYWHKKKTRNRVHYLTLNFEFGTRTKCTALKKKRFSICIISNNFVEKKKRLEIE